MQRSLGTPDEVAVCFGTSGRILLFEHRIRGGVNFKFSAGLCMTNKGTAQGQRILYENHIYYLFDKHSKTNIHTMEGAEKNVQISKRAISKFDEKMYVLRILDYGICSYHEFHETCHSVTFIVLVNSHQR